MIEIERESFMKADKQVIKSLERQQIKHVRHFYRSIAEINLELAKLHRNIELKIDKNKYQLISDYVNQYISYTTIWNVKFVYNLESPEVALLQLLHLEYIFENESESLFNKERNNLNHQMELFMKLKPYKQEHVQLRKQNMLNYIKEQENNPTHF